MVQLLEPKYDQGKNNADLTKLTEDTKIKHILDTLVQKAKSLHQDYIGSKKGLITSTAFYLEEYLKKVKKDEYICRISEILTHILKTRIKGFVTDKYMRRTLHEKYKNPQQRLNSLQQVKSETPGMVKDSGRTIEELQKTLERKQEYESFTTKYTLDTKIPSRYSLWCYLDKNKLHYTIPLIINVKGKEVSASLDMDGVKQLFTSYDKAFENKHKKPETDNKS